MKHSVIPAALVVGILGAGATFAGGARAGDGIRCNVPKAEWQAEKILDKKLTADGWKVRQIKTEDGCYEAYAIDREGHRVEAKFDPKTLMRQKSGG